MKGKRKILLVFVTLMAAALCVSSLNFNAPVDELVPGEIISPPPAGENAPSPAPVVKDMDAQQLAKLNGSFRMMIADENGENKFNPLVCFFTSLYDSVEEIDLRAFLHNFPIETEGSVEEFEALRQSEGWPFAGLASVTEMPVPLHKYPADAVEQVLRDYAGLSLDALRQREGGFGQGVHYLEQYHAFYNYTSDFGLEPFEAYRGELEGDTARLYQDRGDGSKRVLSLQLSGDDFRILSYRELSDTQ